LIESIPTLEWLRTPTGLYARLGDGERLKIQPVWGSDEVSLIHVHPGQCGRDVHESLGTHADEDAAKAYAKTWVGDDG
jgi:hypothetical protein